MYVYWNLIGILVGITDNLQDSEEGIPDKFPWSNSYVWSTHLWIESMFVRWSKLMWEDVLGYNYIIMSWFHASFSLEHSVRMQIRFSTIQRIQAVLVKQYK